MCFLAAPCVAGARRRSEQRCLIRASNSALPITQICATTRSDSSYACYPGTRRTTWEPAPCPRCIPRPPASFAGRPRLLAVRLPRRANFALLSTRANPAPSLRDVIYRNSVAVTGAGCRLGMSNASLTLGEPLAPFEGFARILDREPFLSQISFRLQPGLQQSRNKNMICPV